ncbi:hypothetical protein CGC54_00750 [Capnocytophaga canimorsus]|uniref:Uncharacterized protein n=1 Tax=Capnocytophaga canimorsus TaxID=28188 RepID=A0AAC9Z2H0_9FLAO|nr:hypothetical protein [Capnocytophaga canimorsus]ATA92986.1 hypothetical protein CGC54_00750 [Capnocytophaga canimorsus]
MELKKNNYYEICCDYSQSANTEKCKVVKYLGNNQILYLNTNKKVKLDDTNTTYAKYKNITYNQNLFRYKEISIQTTHLEKLGFEKRGERLYENEDKTIIYCLSKIGYEGAKIESDKIYIGNIFLNKKDKENLIDMLYEKIDKEGKKLEEQYLLKKDNIIDLISKEKENNIHYGLIKELHKNEIEHRIDLHNLLGSVVEQCHFKRIETINQLFEVLEKEGMIIEDKDEIVKS